MHVHCLFAMYFCNLLNKFNSIQFNTTNPKQNRLQIKSLAFRVVILPSVPVLEHRHLSESSLLAAFSKSVRAS